MTLRGPLLLTKAPIQLIIFTQIIFTQISDEEFVLGGGGLTDSVVMDFWPE